MASYAEPAWSDYLAGQLRAHVGTFFQAAALRDLASTDIRFVEHARALDTRGKCIVIPRGVEDAVVGPEVPLVRFNGTELSLGRPMMCPPGGEWKPWGDSQGHPLWYRHSSGTLMPAYDVHTLVLDALTLSAERQCNSRDRHGRTILPACEIREARPRHSVAHFNEFAALLVAGASAVRAGGDPSRLDGLVRGPMMVLSHDVDVVYGCDTWSQLARVSRAVRPLLARNSPDWYWLERVWFNVLHPRAVYLDDIARIAAIEKEFGFRSAFYFMVGRRGRFHSRYGIDALKAALAQVPTGWQVGLHYNYDTLLDPERLALQAATLQRTSGQRPVCGRAHYLRIDTRDSWSGFDEAGISVDETLGFHDRVGFRAGVAGAYNPIDADRMLPHRVIEVPLCVMDGPLLEGCRGAVDEFVSLLEYVGCVGGAVSVLFHPGTVGWPEDRRARGVYQRLLEAGAARGAAGVSACELAALRMGGLEDGSLGMRVV